MGDGTYYRGYAQFAVNGFSLEDVKQLVAIMKQNFDLDFRLRPVMKFGTH